MRVAKVSMLIALTSIMACEATPHAPGARVLAQTAEAPPAEAYFLGREDTRDCEWPECGGFYVRPVGLQSFACLDGTSAAECRVALLDPDPMGGVLLDGFGEGRLVVRGNLESGESFGFGPAPSLQARAAWRPVGGPVRADAALYLVRGKDGALTATRLNTSDALPIRQLVRERLTLATEQEERFGAALAGDGVVVDGAIAGAPAVLTAQQLLLPVAVAECQGTPDCAVTTFPKRVRTAADCYCPTCPQVASPVETPRNEESWKQFCATSHGESACRAPTRCEEPFGSCTAGVCRPVNNL